MVCSRRAVAALAATCSWIGSPLDAQTTATLDLAASYIEYAGFLPSGAGVLSASLRHDAANVVIGGSGSWTVFESGNQIFQATAAGAWLSAPDDDVWRAELGGTFGASKYADQRASGHMLGHARIHALGERSGAWAGLTTGVTTGDSAPVPVEVAAAAWSLQEDLALVGTIAATRVGRFRTLDLVTTVRWTRAPFELESRVGVRPWADGWQDSDEESRSAYGDLSVFVSVSDRIRLSLGGGTYPSDPMRGLLAARYVNAAVSVQLSGSDDRGAREIAAVAAIHRSSAVESGAPLLEVVPGGRTRVVRVHARDAHTVELMGDFTDWQPVSLTQIEPDSWEVRLPLEPGVHRVNVRVDGGPWLVPAGTRAEASEFGSPAGVLVVR